MTILIYIGYSFAALYALWIFFVAVMGLSRCKEAGTLSKPALFFGIPVLVVGYALDIFVNLTVCTVLFLEIPTGWTVTGRLKDHIYRGVPGSWRERMAAWFCANLLNSFDPDGKHC